MTSIFENNVVVLHSLTMNGMNYKPVWSYSNNVWDDVSECTVGKDMVLMHLETFFTMMNDQGEDFDIDTVEDYYENAKRSLSVTDIIILNGTYYRVEPKGWTNLGSAPCLHYSL